MLDFKQQVIAAIDIQREAEDLLGAHDYQRGDEFRYSCPCKDNHKHGDHNNSLTLNVRTGQFKCHACGFIGDLFTLYAEVKSLNLKSDFGLILKQLGAKYGVSVSTQKFQRRTETKEVIKAIKVLPKDNRDFLHYAQAYRKLLPIEVGERLLNNYGINQETIAKRGYAYIYNRLWIPVPKDYKGKNHADTQLVGIRKHDVMRAHAKWQIDDGPKAGIWDTEVPDSHPTWKWRSGNGKSIGVAGFNPVYVYPMEVLLTSREVWLVGGELKADLLNQLGIPAVCWTAGEGEWNKAVIKQFASKIVRVLMDIDDAGERATFGSVGEASYTNKVGDNRGKSPKGLCQVLLENGAGEVYGGRLPKTFEIYEDSDCSTGNESSGDGKIESRRRISTVSLPSNGDVTDFLRFHRWNIKEALPKITWQKFEHVQIESFEQAISEYEFEQVPDFEKSTHIRFNQVVNPTFVGKWLDVSFIIAGKQDTPYLSPMGATATCEPVAIQGPLMQKCGFCPLGKGEHSITMQFSDSERVDFAGMSPPKVRKLIISKFKIPQCSYPMIDVRNDSLIPVVAIPTLDANVISEQYLQLPIWISGLDKESETHELNPTDDNAAYDSVGKIIPQPSDGKITFVASRLKRSEGDVFAFKYNEFYSKRLQEIMSSYGTKEDAICAVVNSLNSHLLHLYHMEKMIRYQLMAFFMPFRYRIGHQPNPKVCAEVCIIGESRCGKSSTIAQLLPFFGAGRYVDVSTATDIGLVGGNTSIGSRSIFTWGVLPMANGGIVVIDEANKLSTEAISALTNIRSSGVAERVTVSGHRKAKANVRILWLANPRDGRELKKYGDPMRAGFDLFGSDQDMARLDMFMIQFKEKNVDGIHGVQHGLYEEVYPRDLARYHLSWAWCLKEHDFVFEDPMYLLNKTSSIIPKNDHPMLYATEARFKVGRIAATIATLTYNRYDQHSVLVDNESVDLACEHIQKMIGDTTPGCLQSTEGKVVIPQELIFVFNNITVENKPKLGIFLDRTLCSDRDLKELFGQSIAFQLMSIIPWTLKLADYNNGKIIWDDRLRSMVREYMR
jgi:hypothetical protein